MNMLITATVEKYKLELVKALGLEDHHSDPAWPLPNMQPSDETKFWGWRSSYSFNAEAWCGQKRVGDEWATIIVYYLGHSQFIDGGFAVAVFRSYGKERVEYFTWKACDNAFKSKNIGKRSEEHTYELQSLMR